MPIKREIFMMNKDEKKVNENKESKGKSSLLSFAFRTAIDVVILSLLALVFKETVGFPSVIRGNSMLPTLHDEDVIFSFRNTDNLKRGDIVLLNLEDREIVTDDTVWIKRVIGLPGDVVEVNPDTSEVTINGEPLNESYIAKGHSYLNNNFEPVTVPDGYYFVMGDNRAHSTDSRSDDIGFVSSDDIIGRFALHLWPLEESE